MLPNVNDFWQIILSQLTLRISTESVDWLQTNVIPIRADDTELVLQVAKPFHKIWLENNLFTDLRAVVNEMNGAPLAVSIITASEANPASSDLSDSTLIPPLPQTLSLTQEERSVYLAKLPEVPPTPSSVPAVSPPLPVLPTTQTTIPAQTDLPIHTGIPINQEYTFTNFIVGKPNQMAFASAKAVAESPAQQQNPFFIYGKSGLGKTHLMHAICNHVRTHTPEKTVLFLTSEQFTNDFISSLSKRDINLNQQFREKYRNVDYLLIDDVQFFGKKDGTQEEFFHTFNELLNYSKQIVMTCDRLPEDIEEIENRLTSRFSAGLVVEIKPPDFEIRSAYLQQLATAEHFPLGADSIQFIAENFYQNMRDVEKAFNRILTYYGIEQQTNHLTGPILLEQTKEYLADLLPKNKRKPLDAEMIIAEIARVYKVDRKKILGKSRPKNIATARQVSMYLCRELLDWSFTQIGSFFSRDHTTIIYAYEKITKKINTDTSFKEEIQQIKQQLVGDDSV